ncbi:hypothetical protein HDU96_002186 [Phlyctochytrium bullatum]|nr:hypothetical protein HDU96_002186 [Phlyctochytrium bullatum]
MLPPVLFHHAARHCRQWSLAPTAVPDYMVSSAAPCTELAATIARFATSIAASAFAAAFINDVVAAAAASDLAQLLADVAIPKRRELAAAIEAFPAVPVVAAAITKLGAVTADAAPDAGAGNALVPLVSDGAFPVVVLAADAAAAKAAVAATHRRGTALSFSAR